LSIFERIYGILEEENKNLIILGTCEGRVIVIFKNKTYKVLKIWQAHPDFLDKIVKLNEKYFATTRYKTIKIWSY